MSLVSLPVIRIGASRMSSLGCFTTWSLLFSQRQLVGRHSLLSFIRFILSLTSQMRRNSDIGAFNMEMKNYSKINGNEVFGAPPDDGPVAPPIPEKTRHSTASTSYFSHHGRFIVWFL